LEGLEEICKDGALAQKILDASKSSMGQEFSELDQTTLLNFCDRVVNGFEYRDDL